MELCNLRKYFTEEIWEIIKDKLDITKEIRLRADRPIILNTLKGEYICQNIVSKNSINEIFNKICEYSIYAYEYSIKNGYITIPGGHRVGFGGQAVYRDGKISTLKYISFVNFRLVHDIVINNIEYEILKDKNVLIISSPGLGKTTLLRNIIRHLSTSMAERSVAVIDERNEISGSFNGVPTINLGPRTDVISDVLKVDGIDIALRSLGPYVIAIDEIGNQADLDAIYRCKASGVYVIASIHGNSLDDIKIKMKDKLRIFDEIILIKSLGEYECFSN